MKRLKECIGAVGFTVAMLAMFWIPAVAYLALKGMIGPHGATVEILALTPLYILAIACPLNVLAVICIK